MADTQDQKPKNPLGAPRREAERRYPRNVNLSNTVFNGLRAMDKDYSVSQVIADLFYAERERQLAQLRGPKEKAPSGALGGRKLTDDPDL